MAHSQFGKCYATVQYNCKDSIVDYLTLSEKKNLFRLHITLEKMQAELELWRANGTTDSVYIAKLDNDIDALLQAVDHYRTAYRAQGQALADLEQSIKIMKRQMRLQKGKAWVGGVLGGLATFGAGVGTAFLILKL